MKEHLPCYGKLFPSTTCLRPGKERTGAVFGYLIEQWGTVRRGSGDHSGLGRLGSLYRVPGVRGVPAAFSREGAAGDGGQVRNCRRFDADAKTAKQTSIRIRRFEVERI